MFFFVSSDKVEIREKKNKGYFSIPSSLNKFSWLLNHKIFILSPHFSLINIYYQISNEKPAPDENNRYIVIRD